MLEVEDIFVENKYNYQETDTYSGDPMKIYIGKLKAPVKIDHEDWTGPFTVDYEYGMFVNGTLLYLADFMFDNLCQSMKVLKKI